jgi:hypothetical protein
MAKLGNPFGGSSQVWITQTYHGSSNTAIDCYWKEYKPNLAVYAIADGKITNTSKYSGSYCAQSVDGSPIDRIWYVHTHNWLPVGTKVKKGQKICEIAPKSKNGGYPEHLHLGLTPRERFYIMDYFDRSIPFRTRYADIRASWFNGEEIDWSNFSNKSYIPLLSKGQKLEIVKDMNIRDSAKKKIGTAKAGAVCIIESAEYVYSGYQYYKVKFADKQCFIADTGFNKKTDKNITNLDGSKPESEVDILKKEIERLELITEAQSKELDKLNQIIVSKNGEIDKLSGVVGAAQEFCTAHTKLEDECNKL